MAIKLDYKDLSLKGYTSINIYRVAGYFDPTQPLPAPLVQGLAANSLTYTDTTAAKNTSYSYLVAGVKDGKVTAGVPFTAGNYNDTGPGPSTIVRGDWFCGYFGEVTSTDLFTSADMKTQISAISGWTLSAINTWYKFIYNGKIIFTPGISVSTQSWLSIYGAGLVYGTDDTGAIPTGVSPNPTRVNQMVRMVKGAWSFIVRAPKGTATPATVTSAVANWANTEVLDIIARLYATTPAVNGKGRFLDVTAPSAVYTNNWYSTSSVAPLSPPDGLGAANPTSGYPYWVPVLELELL